MNDPSEASRAIRSVHRGVKTAAAALAEAYANDVPAYAPELFAAAVNDWREALRGATAGADTEEVRQNLAKAEESLDNAARKAAANRAILFAATRLRADSIRNERERFYAADLLSEAEEHYQSAMAALSEGDQERAGQHVAKALDLYHRATIRHIERGLIEHFDQAIAEVAAEASASDQREIASQIAELRAALADASSGKISTTILRRRTAALGRRISGLLEPGPIIGGGSGAGGGEISAPIDGWAPGTFGPPQEPLTVSIGNRTAHSLQVNWKNREGGDTNFLLRQRADGPWDVVAEFGVLTGWFSHVDQGLDPDTRYSYRVRTENSYGASVTPLNNRAMGHTRGDPAVPVWRVQLRIRTADVNDAGTDNAVRAQLNSPLFNAKPNANSTWLDYGPRLTLVAGGLVLESDDFGRNRDFTYDLKLDHVRELADITMLTLKKEGSNAVAIAEVELIVNGSTVFRRLFGESASTCLWLDNGDGHLPIYTIYYPELRAHAAWRVFENARPTPPLSISNQEMVSRIEAIIGDQLHGTPAYWGHRYGSAWVEANQLDDRALRVDVDLSADVPGFDPEIDLNFDLRFAVLCNPDAGTATLRISTENITSSVDFDWIEEVLTFGLINFAEDDIANAIEHAIQPITQSIAIQAGGLCPDVLVDADGNINFTIDGA